MKKFLYGAYKRKFQDSLGVSESAHPYVFLKRMWTSMVFANALSLAIGAWYVLVEKSHLPQWFMYSAFLSCGPISMAAACAAPVADTWKKHALFSVLTAMFIAFFSVVILPLNPVLLGASLWVMMMLGIFQSRLHERREVNWTTHEDLLAIGAGFVALGAYVLIPTAPWVIVGLLVAVPCLHRVVVWRVLRTQVLSLDQHETVWPRLAKNMSSSDFLASLIFYVTLRNGIPSEQLRRALVKVDIDVLLAYFNYKSVFHPPATLSWHHQDLAQAVKESVCALDDRAVVVFELCGHNMQHAVSMIQEVRTGKPVPIESMALPDLGSPA